MKLLIPSDVAQIITLKKAIDKLHNMFAILTSLKGQVGFLKCGCTRYLSIVIVFPTVDDSQHAPSLEKQTDNVLLWTGSATKHILVRRPT